MHYKMYQSRALIDDKVALHDSILRSSLRNNMQAGLTGFLHREGQAFLQYLEGAPESLETVMARIQQDPRHDEIELVGEGEIGSRYFPDWQMGFVVDGDMALNDYLEREEGSWRFDIEDPFDLIVFLSTNSEILREKSAA